MFEIKIDLVIIERKLSKNGNNSLNNNLYIILQNNKGKNKNKTLLNFLYYY